MYYICHYNTLITNANVIEQLLSIRNQRYNYFYLKNMT